MSLRRYLPVRWLILMDPCSLCILIDVLAIGFAIECCERGRRSEVGRIIRYTKRDEEGR